MNDEARPQNPTSPSPDTCGAGQNVGEPRSLTVPLQGQRLAMFEAIWERDRELADRYLGACVTLTTTGNPENLTQAAHSLRELINELHRIGDIPVKSAGGRLGDKFDAMTKKWEKAKRNSACYSEERGWAGEIDDHAKRGFGAVDTAIDWQAANRPRWRDQFRTTIRELDAARDQLPGWLEDTFVDQWDKTRDYFVDVAHHRRSTTSEEFTAVLSSFETFVLDRLKPRTFEEHEELDQLISEAEDD
jgi:hypothetical protein